MGHAELNTGTLLYHNVFDIKIAVVVLAWDDAFIDRFWSTYQKFSPGIDHKLLVVRNMGGGTQRLNDKLVEISEDVEVCTIQNLRGYAWHYGYQKLKDTHDYIFFTTDSVWINRDHWLLHSFLALYTPGTGMVAHQYRNGNLRQDLWGAKVEVLNKLNWGKAKTIQEWYELGRRWEWKDLCFSRQCQNLGYNIAQIGVRGTETIISGGDYEYLIAHLKDIPDYVWDAEPPNLKTFKYELSLLFKSGKYKEISDGLSFFPKKYMDPDLFRIMGVALVKQNKFETALEVLKEGLELTKDATINNEIDSIIPIYKEIVIDQFIFDLKSGKDGSFAAKISRISEIIAGDAEISAIVEIVKTDVTSAKTENCEHQKINHRNRFDGYLELIKGNVGAAEAVFRSTLADRSNDFRAMIGLAEIYLERGEFELAERLLKHANELFQCSPLLFYLRGSVYKGLKDIKKSIYYFQRSLEMYPDNVMVRHELSELMPSDLFFMDHSNL